MDGSRVANANHSTPGHAVRAIDGWMDGWRDEREREEDDDGCDWWGRGRGEEQMRRPTTVAYLYLPPS